MSKETPDVVRPAWWPDWFNGKSINESDFCRDFLSKHKLAYADNAFFTPEGRLTDETWLKNEIYGLIHRLVSSNVSRRITNLIDLMKISAQTDALPLSTSCVHVANGTVYLDGHFEPGKNEVVRARLPVVYDPNAARPVLWLRFLSQLLYPEDIPTLQEFVGYCLIPSNKGQRMMVIKGKGGEGKSQVGAVLSHLFGNTMKDGSVGKLSENRFSRADLEHVLLMVDDDMQMEALKQTNYIKSIVTAHGTMDLERKGQQSYQGQLYARILAFSNGDLQALYDRSDGFYRRQLILTTRDRPANRVDDPFIAEEITMELPGILNWALEGLDRLMRNGFRFTESARSAMNRQESKQDANNVIAFLQAADYVCFGPEYSICSKDLYELYDVWCVDNAEAPVRPRTFSQYLIANQEQYGITADNARLNSSGRRVRGYRGIGSSLLHSFGGKQV